MFGVVTQPRPVSKELPVWVTTAGNPETWRDAGRLGANVLTHLLGQSVAEVGDKVKIYRAAWPRPGMTPPPSR
jgi:alkanesulfonate monooxygenase SsuD/methylene tetrahydromethanopterin reductase-like flavin-dependent oxidoreductase (luciferase family)